MNEKIIEKAKLKDVVDNKKNSFLSKDTVSYLNEIVAMPVRERIARAKYLPEAELNKIDEVAKELEKGIDELVNKGGVANA